MTGRQAFPSSSTTPQGLRKILRMRQSWIFRRVGSIRFRFLAVDLGMNTSDRLKVIDNRSYIGRLYFIYLRGATREHRVLKL